MSLGTEQLAGKLCVITGAAKSIGLDIAERCCEYGAKVVLMDMDKRVLESAKALKEKGMRASGYVIDVTDRGAVMALFDEIVAEHGPVYALVNSAGVAEVKPFEETMPETWEKIFQVNVFGTVYCIQGAIRSMKQQRRGKIINFASKAGKSGSKLMTAYGASKGAVITLTQALAQEYAADRININCMCPDIIDDTGVWNTVSAKYCENLSMRKEEVTKLYESKIPLGRFVKKEDITDLVCFFMISGDDCTGQAINITGGRTMH